MAPMSMGTFNDDHRFWQDRFHTRRIADRNKYRVLETRSLYFESGQAEVRREDLNQLEEVATALKGDPKTADLPVILLSARAQSADVQRGLDVGVDEYVTKPFDPLELVDLVLSVLDRVKR